MSLETIEKDADIEEASEEKAEDEKDPTKLKQRTPPSRGMCMRCGHNKPINRLMLCYPCWVKSELTLAHLGYFARAERADYDPIISDERQSIAQQSTSGITLPIS